VSDHTHTALDTHRRTEEPGEPPTVFEEGDELTPTEAELDAFGDKFEPIEDAGQRPAASSPDETSDTGGDDPAEADAEPAAEAGEAEEDNAAPAETEDGDPLTVERIEAADYPELRTMAAGFEGINGNWGADRLKAELRDRIDT